MMIAETIVMSLPPTHIITLFEGAPPGMVPQAGDQSLVGMALDEAWPDSSLFEATKRMADQNLDTLSLESDVTINSVRRFYRYQITPIRELSTLAGRPQ